MVAELRKSGKRWVIYTDDTIVYKHLNKYVSPANRVPYTKNGKVIGIDYYFDRRSARAVKRIAKGQMLLGI
jgi:hypothetical protein